MLRKRKLLVGYWLSFKPKTAFLGQKTRTLKIPSLIVTSWRRHEPSCDTHFNEMINGAKCDVSKPGSFGGFKTDRQNCALYVRLHLIFKDVLLYLFRSHACHSRFCQIWKQLTVFGSFAKRSLPLADLRYRRSQQLSLVIHSSSIKPNFAQYTV